MSRLKIPDNMRGLKKTTFPICPKCHQKKLKQSFKKNTRGRDDVFIACTFCGFHYFRDEVRGDVTW